jgi:hypothetical protein
MNLSDKEQTFLVRGLDKATTRDKDPDRSAIAQMPTGKILFLVVLSLAIAFLCFHGIFASLIFGLLLAFPMIGSRWFRRLLGFIGLVIAGFFAYLLLYKLNYHVKDQAELERMMRANETSKSERTTPGPGSPASAPRATDGVQGNSDIRTSGGAGSAKAIR